MTCPYQSLALINTNRILAWFGVQQARYMKQHKLTRKPITKARLLKYAILCSAGIGLACDRAKTQKDGRKILAAVGDLLHPDATTFLRAL